jgi:transcriptional regulator with XRE-family HTH domain
MDEAQRRRAGAAVEREMEAQGLTLQDLSEMSGVALVTIRDLIRGRRWPWTSKRYAIELALEWPGGRIAEIAKGNYPAAPGEGERSQLGATMAEMLDALVRDHGAQGVLEELLRHTELSPARRARAVATYLELVEEQQHAGGGRRGRPRSMNGAGPEEEEVTEG